MEGRILHLFTRTPMHIGAGASVGAIDLPVVRERHTKFPVIPGSSLKGVLADLWEGELDGDGDPKRGAEAEWLFGAEDAKAAAAGALLIGEGRLLAFPVRSARGAFAWLTCPLALARFSRALGGSLDVPEAIPDDECLSSVELALSDEKVVLEEYCFKRVGHPPSDTAKALLAAMPDDPVWSQLPHHLVILSDGLMSFFAENACEVANRIRINDLTGTVDSGALFNQENVPSECMFFSVVNAQRGRGADHRNKQPAEALDALIKAVSANGSTLQVGGDETTGLGWCSVSFTEVAR